MCIDFTISRFHDFSEANSRIKKISSIIKYTMLLDQELLNTLTAQAKASPRLRQNYDLRIVNKMVWRK